MIFGVTRLGPSGVIYNDSPNKEVQNFCSRNRIRKGSKCRGHYDNLFVRHESHEALALCQCPYGLVTTTAIGGKSGPIIFTSFLLDNFGSTDVPEEVASAARTDELQFQNLKFVISEIASSIRNEELDHFEAALHDTRHLNHSISQNAEQLLGSFGFPADKEWDLKLIQKDESARRALTIFAASRDLSQSITMHEISRDPSRAASGVAPTQIHKIFYRQMRISAERMEKHSIRCNLGTTQRSISLSSAFKLIPKILLDNAIKYSQRGGTIDVVFMETSSFFVIECRNSGMTVKEDEIGGLFRRGARGSNKNGSSGQGIGLWLAKIIVEANKGLIHFGVHEKGVNYAGRREGETIVTIKLPR